MILLSIDPGLRGCGCALWRYEQGHTGGPARDRSRVLVRAEYVLGSADAFAPFANVVGTMTAAVAAWRPEEMPVSHFSTLLGTPFRLVIERQRTYGGRAGRGDASDLIDVATVVGSIVGRLDVPTRIVLPQEWGCAAKDVNEARAREALTGAELARVVLPGSRGRTNKKLATNVWDAIGIGLAEPR